MPTAWGCFRAARLRRPASATWPLWLWWGRSARTSTPSATFGSCIWRPFATCLGRYCVVAGEAGLVKLGNVATDGTKMQENASRHKAMSYGYMRKEADRLREDIEALVMQAHQQDAEDDAALGSRRGDELPAELARRADRLATIEAAMRRLEARAKADAEAERQRRAEVEAERQRLGRPRRGKAPKPVDETPDDKAQTNFTDPELQIMRTNNKG